MVFCLFFFSLFLYNWKGDFFLLNSFGNLNIFRKTCDSIKLKTVFFGQQVNSKSKSFMHTKSPSLSQCKFLSDEPKSRLKYSQSLNSQIKPRTRTFNETISKNVLRLISNGTIFVFAPEKKCCVFFLLSVVDLRLFRISILEPFMETARHVNYVVRTFVFLDAQNKTAAVKWRW